MAQISYQSKNYMPVLSSTDWTLNNAVVNSNGTITILPEGSASCYISALVDKSYSYTKTVLDVTSLDINNESNFNSKVGLYINQYYYDDNHLIYKNRSGIFGVNTYNVIDESIGRYRDINEIPNRTDLVAGVLVILFNCTESDLIVNNCNLYISQDINKHQASDIYNECIRNNRANKVDFKLDAVDDGVVGMELLGDFGSDLYNFRFLNNKLSRATSTSGCDMLVTYSYVTGTTNTSGT